MSEQYDRSKEIRLGGSDSPVVLGVSPFKDALTLYHQKRGELPPEPETPAMLRGKYLEPVIADLYAEQTGRTLTQVAEATVHPDFDFIIGHPDRRIVGNRASGTGVLEIKAPGLQVFSRAMREGLPQYCYVQLQKYIGLEDADFGAFAFFSAERWQLVHFDVERDDELIDMIYRADQDFWQRIQESNPPPAAEATVVDLPKIGGAVFQLADQGFAEAVNDLRVAQQIETEAKSLVASAKGRIQDYMLANDAEAIELPDEFRAYWKPQAGRVQIDAKRLKAEKPEVYEQYLKQAKPSRPFKTYFLKQRNIE